MLCYEIAGGFLTMYNLFVSGRDDAWEGKPCIFDLDRCVRDQTNDELIARFGTLDAANVNELRRLPCIFSYESQHKKNPKFGVLRNITIRQRKVKIEYDVIDLEQFLTEADLHEDGLAFDLDVSSWEMNQTHWAVKDINLAKALQSKGIVLPGWAQSDAKIIDIAKHPFTIALSFPGEIRNYIKPIAVELERIIGPNSYFYDNNYVSQLARPSLDILLQDIYRNRSKLVVVFLCSDYQEKEWCGIEFRAVREIMMEREHQKIMFVKMDEGPVDGVFKTDGYIDGLKFCPTDIARFIHERVNLF
jgi:hypothetical protein